jgi:hypothetical protein
VPAGIQLDSTVLAFTAAITMVSAILFGIAPAWQASRVNLLDALKQGGRGGTDSSHKLRWALIAAEVALSVVLLIGAGLMIRTLAGLIANRPRLSRAESGHLQPASARLAFYKRGVVAIVRRERSRASSFHPGRRIGRHLLAL